MIRRAFTMRLKPGALPEYKHHHDNIWPELVAEIERSGIASITTFQNELDLFLVSEIADEAAWDRLWNSEVHKRWAELMQPLMHLREDGIVDAGQLAEVFHLKINTDGRSATPPVADMIAEALAHVESALEQSGSPPASAKQPAVAPARKKTRGAKTKSASKPSPHKKSLPNKKSTKKPARPAVKKAAKKSAKKASKKSPAKTKKATQKPARGKKR